MRRFIWTDSGVKERGDNRMEQILQTRNVPVTGEYDVVVCGGGPGGWIAAASRRTSPPGRRALDSCRPIAALPS